MGDIQDFAVVAGIIALGAVLLFLLDVAGWMLSRRLTSKSPVPVRRRRRAP